MNQYNKGFVALIVTLIIVAIVLIGSEITYYYITKTQPIVQTNIQPQQNQQNQQQNIQTQQNIINQNSQNNKPSIIITSPSGGELWRVGEIHNITWQYSNLPTSNGVSITINFEMHIGGPSGVDYTFDTAEVPISAKSYSWKIPQPIIQKKPALGSTFFTYIHYDSPDHSHTPWGWGLRAFSKYFSIL